MKEFYFKIIKSKDSVDLINYLSALKIVEPVKVVNKEIYKRLPISIRNSKLDPETLFGIWKNEKKSLGEIRKNWKRESKNDSL